MIALAKSHPYLPDSRSSIVIAPCECGQARNYRAHQPIWWRVLYPRRKWR